MTMIFAKKIGKVEVVEQLISLKNFREDYDPNYSIYENDGKTPLSEDTIGYVLHSTDAGKPWFVSKKFFDANYEIIKE